MKTLEAWLALLERRHPRAIDLGLERCGSVYRQLGSPRPAKRVITVAGTNGKGSTVAYLAAMSGSLGQRCGTYTSPHILRFNERINIMGEPVSDQRLVAAFEAVEAARSDVSLTYFEFTTLAALLIMHRSELDCAVLEVGLGGRLDTVNLVDADCAVITPIGLDHQDFLGPDLESIATEKAGIMRAGIPVVCTQREPPEPILQAADRLGAQVFRRGVNFDLGDALSAGSKAQQGDSQQPLLFTLGEQSLTVPHPPMEGSHQLDNLAAALAATALLNPECTDKADEIAAAIAGTKVPGRLQKINTSPAVLLDVGHNALAAEAVAAYLDENVQSGVTCVLAMLADKPAEDVARALDRVCGHWLCADSPGDRGQCGESLARRVKAALPAAQIKPVASVETAMEEAFALTPGSGTILVFGSFLTVSSAVNWLKNSNHHGMHDAVRIT